MQISAKTLLRQVQLLLLGVVCLSTPAKAQTTAETGFVVIANPANPVSVLRRTDLSRLFLLQRRTWPSGQSVEPIDQVESSRVRRQFSNAIHEMDVPRVKSFWQDFVFSGKGEPPPERASDEEVIAFVRRHPNAVGYVATSARLDGVRALIVVR